MRRMPTLAALPLLVAASLTTAGSVDPDSFLRTAPYELVTGFDRESWCSDDEDAQVLDADADLRGPHFTLSAECLFQRATIPARQRALDAALTHTPPAAPGIEFVFAQFADQADYLPEIGSDPLPVSAWIEAGPKRIHLPEAPGLGDFLILTVPVGESVILWVDDVERAQGLDLRTGAQIDPVTAYYSELGFWTEEVDAFEFEEVKFGRPGHGWILTCRRRVAELDRSAWSKSQGWAPEGSVFLEVRFNWCGSAFDELTWTVDPDEDMVVVANTEVIAPVDWESAHADRGTVALTVAFLIPADDIDATVQFSPRGDAVEQDSGEKFAIADDLPPTVWTVEF